VHERRQVGDGGGRRACATRFDVRGAAIGSGAWLVRENVGS